MEDEYSRILSKYTVQKQLRDFLKTLLISLWDVLGALLRPRGITTYSKRLNLV